MKDYSSPCFGISFTDPISMASFHAVLENTNSKISLKSSAVARFCCTGRCSRELLEKLCCNEIESAVFKLTHLPISSEEK